ncbi:MAG: hypothetical protein LUH14_10760 [Clostridiaceae bacterium]|nr:hypothetical protein [Clostridiaceae bacterium]
MAENEALQMKETEENREDISVREIALQEQEAAAQERETFLQEQEAAAQEREKVLREQETAAQEWEKALQEQEAVAQEREKALQEQEAAVREREKTLHEREMAILEGESALLKREGEMQRRENEQEVLLRKSKIEAQNAMEAELARERADALVNLQKQITQERVAYEEGLNQIRQDRTSEMEAVLKEKSEALENQIFEKKKTVEAELLDKEKDLSVRELQLEEKELEVEKQKRISERQKRRLEAKEEELEERESELAQEVERKCEDQIKACKAQLSEKDRSLEELRGQIKALLEEQEAVENFKVSLGENPSLIQNRIRNLISQNEQLKMELAKRPTEDIQKEREELDESCRGLRLEVEDLSEKNRKLEKKNGELARFEVENVSLKSKTQELESLVQELRGQNDNYKSRIARLSVSEAALSDRDQRIAEIRKGYLPPITSPVYAMELSETDWLDFIYKQCDSYGIHFPQRILYAFHTALKISDWSSITVLAGVSGTGKSELPKLYAAFGGMNFINVPVQPSWDSQESMLGFFNSIDNRFEPEPLLRFLVQCTEDPDFNKYMSIVLLDEMNLAHVEHYFADFLSKLETRRGTNKSNLPTIEVKLGAGVEPYQLRLERSVLWTGTMNQDETTKSLSDKVLDRGLVINFPRPRTLKSRTEMGILEEVVRDTHRPMLTRRKWGSWVVRNASLQGDQLKELDAYRNIVEAVNEKMEHIGRALGHRVWQSIEFYILNYPSVAAEMGSINQNSPGEMTMTLRGNMKIAFEDQIVQKIMPKLRGVETRGQGKKYLEEIEQLLENNGFEQLKDDFKIACEQGYGQFIWSSAKYIEADDLRKAESISADANEQKQDAGTE